jgi:hypothetical protein
MERWECLARLVKMTKPRLRLEPVKSTSMHRVENAG